jgi:hypothetical protein
MNIKRIIFFVIILFNFQLLYAQPFSIQRYAWLGSNEEGTKVALMLSHFGPSSQAPFVKLLVKQAGEADPLFVDTAMQMSGGEKELAELAMYLLKKNTDKLNELGITLSNDFLSEASSVTIPNHDREIASGWVDIENVGLNEFTIVGYKSDTCPKNSDGIALDIALNGTHRLTARPTPDNCWNDSFLLRNIFRTKKALWFIINMHAYGLGDTDTYWIEVQGVNF